VSKSDYMNTYWITEHSSYVGGECEERHDIIDDTIDPLVADVSFQWDN